FDMLDHRLAAGPGNADHVEARVALLQFSLGEKILRGLNHLLLLAKLDGFEGRAETAAGAGFDFHENHHAAVEHDQVQLARGAAVVALDQLVALFSEVILGEPLAFSAEELPAVIERHDRTADRSRSAGARPRAPAGSCGGESARRRGAGARRNGLRTRSLCARQNRTREIPGRTPA